MSRLGQAVICVTCALIISREARAQTCLGTAQFSSGRARVAASASFNSGASEYDGQIAFGAKNGLFVSASGGQIVPKGGGGNATTIGANLGYSLAIGSAGQFCPLAAYAHATFPDVTIGASTFSSSENDIGFGGAVGARAQISAQASIVPYMSAAYVHASVTASSPGLGSATQSQDYGVLEFGLGLVINKSVTLRPNVSVPVGLTGGLTTVGIALGFNFGH